MNRIRFALSRGAAGLVLLGTSSMATAAGGPSSEDEKQEHQIQARFQKAADLDHDRIKVNVDDGIAVLEGTVDSQQEKTEAQRLAHVDGILGVNNRLKVRGETQ